MSVLRITPGGVEATGESLVSLVESLQRKRDWLAGSPRFEPEQPLPTLISGDIALTSTPPKDGAGARAQVVRRQPDGSWLRLLDQPEFTPHTS